jgi:superfamily II DNA or RNA helicase
MDDYQQFIEGKRPVVKSNGFDAGSLSLYSLFDWQVAVASWAIRRGRAALFCDCGMGKTFMQLVWADAVAQHTQQPVILHCPVGVRQQTVREAAKFGIATQVATCDDDGDIPDAAFIAVVNYEKLHRLKPDRFSGVVLDESSILKSFAGKTKQRLVSAYRHTPYRLACTATPAPNDHTELGNHSEFLGVMPSSEMLSRWFLNDTMKAGGYRLKGHAATDYWNWLATWAVCMTKPSDINPDFSDDGYVLPEMRRHDHIVTLPQQPANGQLFGTTMLSATTLHTAKRESCDLRAAKVAELIHGNSEPWIVWCDTDYEANALVAAVSRVSDSFVEVRGSDKESQKEQKLAAFSTGQCRVIITKPDIAGFGMNWQHCRNVAFVGLSYSYEKFYQAVRRSYRFGQTQTVNVHVVSSEVETAIEATVAAKQKDHNRMQSAMVDAMRHVQRQSVFGDVSRKHYAADAKMATPEWLASATV